MSAPVRLRPIPLWDAKWGYPQLRAKATKEPRIFERGWRLIALSDDERTFPSFEKCYAHGIVLGETQRAKWPCFTGVDLSSKNRPGNAIVTIAVNPNTRRRMPIDLRVGAWRSHEVCAQLADVNRLYSPTVIKVENNAYQDSLIDWIQTLKFDFWYKVEGTRTGSNKVDPLVGLPGLQVEFSNGAWTIPSDEYEMHPPGHQCAWCIWDYEFRNHPVSATTDMVMATWFARQGIEEHGFIFEDLSSMLPGKLTAR